MSQEAILFMMLFRGRERVFSIKQRKQEKGFFQEILFDFCYNEKISKKVGWIWLD